MTRSIDQIKCILFTLIHIVHLDRMALDGNALLLLQVHGIKDLILHIATVESIRHFKHSVRQSTLSMVNMRNDAKISCLLHRTSYQNVAKIT